MLATAISSIYKNYVKNSCISTYAVYGFSRPRSLSVSGGGVVVVIYFVILVTTVHVSTSYTARSFGDSLSNYSNYNGIDCAEVNIKRTNKPLSLIHI